MSVVAPFTSSGNWLCEPGRNPFNLLPPPESFRRELAIYDPDAVIMPSAQRYAYWLLRRRKYSAGLTNVLPLDKDSTVMARYGLVPVTTFGGHITWGPQVLQWLADRDTWRHGGAAKAADIVEERERVDEARLQRSIDAENEARAKSMYRTYKLRAGESIVLNDQKGKTRRNKRTVYTDSDLRQRPGSAPVPPTAPVMPLASGWTSTASGLVTPPTS